MNNFEISFLASNRDFLENLRNFCHEAGQKFFGSSMGGVYYGIFAIGNVAVF